MRATRPSTTRSQKRHTQHKNVPRCRTRVTIALHNPLLAIIHNLGDAAIVALNLSTHGGTLLFTHIRELLGWEPLRQSLHNRPKRAWCTFLCSTYKMVMRDYTNIYVYFVCFVFRNSANWQARSMSYNYLHDGEAVIHAANVCCIHWRGVVFFYDAQIFLIYSSTIPNILWLFLFVLLKQKKSFLNVIA